MRGLKSDGMTMLIATHEMGVARDFAQETRVPAPGRSAGRSALISGDPASLAGARVLERT